MLNYITWNVSREIFSLGPLVLRWYGLLFASGFAIGYFIMQKIFKQEGIKEEVLDKLTMYMVVSTVLGARLGHCLFYEPDYYLAHPLKILMIWEGGLASHGAAVGILFGLYLFSKNVSKLPYLWILDRIVIVVALGGACIRLGNLFNSEIYGKVTDVAWAFRFVVSDGPNALPRHPTQIYEALFCFALFYFLLKYYYKHVTKMKDGIIFSFFLILLFGFRFFVEFLKAEQVDFEKGMTFNMGQWLSVPFVLIGVLLFIKQSRTTPHNYLIADQQKPAA
ncbi:prolipoprotein diacylglyceryl transferase [Solitalea longa]|uniref:Phosphatidylglycerol--prolipoprotein diacylglyceryl transferase n=1 Tax=Solitalea longa TaxID=2079460 RepID=A0A2S5A0X2_9SPHI|nr:prolipoprotein diacylglyceryl transferase [Solitalea longa]POY36231.1 prolipoprotein diacylglyceryl transferase [Solitalea longa]